MITDEIIIKNLFNDGKIIKSKMINNNFLNKNPEMMEYLLNRFSDSESIHESLLRIFYKIETRPACPICGKKVAFHGRHYKLFEETCSRSCSYKFTKEKRIKSCLEKYGTDNPAKNKEIIQKTKNTCLEKYGGICPYSNKEIRAKGEQINLKKYGYKNPFENPNIKSISILKGFETRKKNGTCNTSKIEEQVYQLLIEEFSAENVIRQYKEERYPWHCDFYIKSLDLFIEINGNWTHGPHPFDGNNPEDIELLELWKSKDSKFYNCAIKTWTDRDIQKRTKAKENNLNYIEIFSTRINEIIDIIKAI